MDCAPAPPAVPPPPQRYRYRLVVDESLALGVLGARGRGAAEHFGCAPDDVEIVGGSMGAPLLRSLGWAGRAGSASIVCSSGVSVGCGRGRANS